MRLKDYDRTKDGIRETAQAIYDEAVRQGNRYPLIPVAQSILESGWYKKSSGKNNFFGQKATKSQSGRDVMTKEEVNGKLVPMNQRFRDYESVSESIQDHLKKWQPVYNQKNSLDDALSAIAPKYATDSTYKSKLKSVIASLEAKNIIDSTPEQQISSAGNIVRETLGSLYTPIVPTIPPPAEQEEQEEIQQNEERIEDPIREQLDSKVEAFNTLQSLFSQPQQISPTIQQEQAQQQTPLTDPYSEITGQTIMQDGGKIPVSSEGMYQYPNQQVIVPTDGSITMKNINHPILGISLETGEQKVMMPEMEYSFPNTQNVFEQPLTIDQLLRI